MEQNKVNSIEEFLEEHCNDSAFDPVGRRVYLDDNNTTITLLNTIETLFEYKMDGYSVTANNRALYTGYDELRNQDTLFLINRFEKFGRDVILARFPHVEIQLEGEDDENG